MPVLSRFECDWQVHRMDANEFINIMPEVDVAYIDPPYNQHPYGSNYFMLNLLCSYEEPTEYSKVSGIPTNWNRSAYNKPQPAAKAMRRLLQDTPAKFLVISYNSEGFITPDEFEHMLEPVGKYERIDTLYNTFRGCRNLKDRPLHVTEYVYVVEKF